MSTNYRVITPESESSSYKPNTIINFNVPIPSGYTFAMGSLRITGNLTVTKADPPVPLDGTENVAYDSQAGIHGFIRNIVSTVSNVNTGMETVIENISYYNRYCKSYFEAGEHFYSQALNSKTSNELIVGQDLYTKYILLGEKKFDGGNFNTNTGTNSWAMKPQIALNRTSTNISSGQCTNLKIQITLESETGPLFVMGVGAFPANLAWSLSDLKVFYIMYPEITPVTTPLEFVKIYNSKRDLISSLSNFSFNPPSNVLAISCNFTRENVGDTKNKLQTEVVNFVKNVDFLISGSESYIRFTQKELEEIVANYILSLNPLFLESNAIYSVNQNKGYGIGINFLKNPINMKQNKLSVSIELSQFMNKYAMYAFFTCIDTV